MHRSTHSGYSRDVEPPPPWRAPARPLATSKLCVRGTPKMAPMSSTAEAGSGAGDGLRRKLSVRKAEDMLEFRRRVGGQLSWPFWPDVDGRTEGGTGTSLRGFSQVG